MKYIVYKTTNVLNGYIYVGVHKTLNPESFDGYLGCGIFDKDIKNIKSQWYSQNYMVTYR